MWDDQRLITSARAPLELICSPGTDPASIGLLVDGVDQNLLSPGQTVRRAAATP